MAQSGQAYLLGTGEPSTLSTLAAAAFEINGGVDLEGLDVFEIGKLVDSAESDS